MADATAADSKICRKKNLQIEILFSITSPGASNKLKYVFCSHRLGMNVLAFFSSGKKILCLISIKGIAVTVVTVVATMLVVGSFGHHYPIFGQEPDVRDQSVGFGIRGHALIKGYHSDGTLYRIWEGDNSLTVGAINAIVSCATGVSTAPHGFGKCNSWMTAMEIAELVQSNGSVFFAATAAATQNLIPQGCNPASPTLSNCTGWQSQATFNGEITQEASINSVRGYDGSNGYIFDFLTVDPPIEVRPGDTLNVILTFTVSS